MKYLLDTHTLLWFMNGDKSLPFSIRSLISDKSNDCSVSIACLWEIAIKLNIGELELKT